MITKLYANGRCIQEILNEEITKQTNLLQKISELELNDTSVEESKPKSHNCPNCGAPITSYICEYCGTEFEKPKKKLSDEEMRESFAELARKQRQAELQASQEWQTQNLLSTIRGLSYDSYNFNTQIMNRQDNINALLAIQTCSLHDQMRNASIQTNIYPANHAIEQKEKPLYIESVNQEADEELATALMWFIIGMVLFTLFAIGVTIIYNLK